MKINHKEIRLTTTCPFCGEVHSIWINEVDYNAWFEGELAQDAFPYLSADEREMLISGICPTCWDGMFGIPEDDEDFEIDEDADWGYNEDMGYDPYLGCYTDDC